MEGVHRGDAAPGGAGRGDRSAGVPAAALRRPVPAASAVRSGQRWLALCARVVALAGLFALLPACGGGGGSGSGDGADTGGGGGIEPEPLPQVLSLAGTIRVADSVRVDGDVNDPEAPYAYNDEREFAQVLSNPSVLNGFASAAPAGSGAGRFASVPDWRDVYAVELLEGQQITLRVSDHDADDPLRNDLDLFLYDSDMTLQSYADGTGEFEILRVPPGQGGSYYIVVDAAAGISKYVLYVGNSAGAGIASQAAGSQAASSADFRPNEAIVRFRDAASALLAPQDDTLSALRGVPDVRLAADVSGRAAALLSWRDGSSGRELLAMLGAGLHGERLAGRPGLRGLARVAGRYDGAADPLGMGNPKYLTRKLLKALSRRSDIASIEPNYRVQAAAVPDDALYPSQWNYPFIKLPAAWDVARVAGSGNAVTVAVIDTGVLLGHPDLAGSLTAGYDFISDPAVAADGDGIDANPDDVGDRRGPSKLSSFHGTHVAGTVAAQTGNRSGVAGVSWGAVIMPIRVLGLGGGSSFDLLQGLRYAAGLDNASGKLPARRADIINLSLGCSECYSQALQDAITAARAAGVIVVAAAGNAGSEVQFYPAAYEGVVAVGAVTSGSARASYSNFGDFVDVVAPGGDDVDRDGDGYPDRILSTMGDDSSGAIEFRYGWSSGTSMAAPHVTGVAALMKAVYPQLSPAQFDAALASGVTVDDLGASGRDKQYGFGLIDAYRAVQAAQALAGEPVGGFISATPTALDFPVGTVARRFSLTRVGQNAPSVRQVVSSEPWLTVTPAADVDASGFGEYVAAVDRSGLGGAVYRARVEVWQSDDRVLDLPVYLEVPTESAGVGDAGRLYVLLIDADTQDVVQQTEVERSPSGEYPYAFPRAAGKRRYRLYAGSDIDNDFIICTPGESCGAYPTLDDVHVFEIDGALRDVDFEVGIQDQFGLGPSAPLPGEGIDRLR